MLHQLFADYQKRVSFLAVYITEAHARDEWPVGKKISFCDQPTTLEARCALADKFLRDRECKLPMLVDTMDNDFQKNFAAWPFRFYIIQNGKLALKAQPDASNFTYDLQTIRGWLDANC
jgi:hypothetical protein